MKNQNIRAAFGRPEFIEVEKNVAKLPCKILRGAR